MTRQQRRAAERASAKARIHADVEAGDTVRDLWTVYRTERFERQAVRPLEPEHYALLQEVFYAGVSAMFQLMNKAAGTDDDDAGVARMQRLYEELETYVEHRP